MEGEALHLVAEFGECGCCGGAGKTGANHEHSELPLVRGVHEFHVELVTGPTVLNGTGGDLGVESDCAHLLLLQPTTPVSTAMGNVMLTPATRIAKPAAKPRRIGLWRGLNWALMEPRLWKMLQAPW
ncbi:unannotated protein [freshwater metagenome]|uniref:Unannotated protein n=1 Tax=freshwater metagenome TaxID=449393 RepID=A0A6J6I649_9ZZZZ